MLSPGDLGVSVRGEVGGAADAALGAQTLVGQRLDLRLLLAFYFGLKFVMVVMGHLASAFFLLHLLVLAICGLFVWTLA